MILQQKEQYNFKTKYNKCIKCGEDICFSEYSCKPGAIVEGKCKNILFVEYSKPNNGCNYRCVVERQEDLSLCFYHKECDILGVQLELFK